MSKLNVDQKSIYELFSDKKSDFLIPDYQRPYAWTEDNCQTLWDDIFTFAFPDNNCDQFDDNEEYFLGSIVTFKNEQGRLEIIDGQQRLTTLMLVLRAFYDRFEQMQDENSKKTREMIEKCIWKTDTFGNADKNSLKIDSEVATDNDKDEFINLLKTGKVGNNKSQYVENYNFFEAQIAKFLETYPSYFPYLPARILGNCILLPIEAESQDTALRIFSTLNDRGLPLSDADIFKAQFYKYYGDKEQKEDFIKRWRSLEDITKKIFKGAKGSPLDELFARYMYYLRAKQGNKQTTVEALRKFYERNKYQALKNDTILQDLESLAHFWESILSQDENTFSVEVLKKLYVLNYAPNGMWEYITSVYFLKNRNQDNELKEEEFGDFLDKITAFIYVYAVVNPGVNALRRPVFEEMINIVNNKQITFQGNLPNKKQVRSILDNYTFTNNRPVTRSIITWYTFTFEDQVLPNINEYFNLEHIFAKKRYEMEGNSLEDVGNLEVLGNKILLEESINIKASDYRFEDKKKIYSGKMRRGRNQEESKIKEIQELIKMDKFEEGDIINRNNMILERFISNLEDEKLLQEG